MPVTPAGRRMTLARNAPANSSTDNASIGLNESSVPALAKRISSTAKAIENSRERGRHARLVVGIGNDFAEFAMGLQPAHCGG